MKRHDTCYNGKKKSINLSSLQFSHFRSVFHIDKKKKSADQMLNLLLVKPEQYTVFQQGVVLCTVQYL